MHFRTQNVLKLDHQLYCLQCLEKIELISEHFRVIISHNFQRELSRQEMFDELKFLYGDETPCHSTMRNWFN